MAAVMRALTSGGRPASYLSPHGGPAPTTFMSQSVDELLTCKVCLGRYSPDADGKKLPRELECRHVFCQGCLEACGAGGAERGGKMSLTCPLCKKKTVLAGNNVMSLPVNRQLLGLIKSSGNSPVMSHHKSSEPSSSSSGHSHHHHHHHSHSHHHDVDDVEQQMSRQSLHGGGGGASRTGAGRGGEEGGTKKKSCSCEHKSGGQKQTTKVVAKSALKKVTLKTSDPDPEEHTAIVKPASRLHPPPPGSAFVSVEGVTLQPEQTAHFGSAHQSEEHGSLLNSVEKIDEIENGETLRYPLDELHCLAPKSFVDDLHRHSGDVTDGHHDYMSMLVDTLHMQPTSAKYVSSFGKYSQVRTQPGAFSSPTKIACSVESKLLIVDPGNETVQVFSPTGECLAIFSVTDITGACFIDETSLAIASGRGIELYRISGRLVLTIPIGPTIAIARYHDGFVAAHPKRLSIGRTPTTSVKIHTVSGARRPSDAPGATARTIPFENITDVAVGAGGGEFCVLDNRSVIVVDYDGNLLTSINPLSLLPGICATVEFDKDVFQPYALAVDPTAGHLVLSDSRNRYVSAFALPGGGFVKCLVNLRDQVENEGIRAYGVAVNSAGQVFLVLRAQGIAETAIYSM